MMFRATLAQGSHKALTFVLRQAHTLVAVDEVPAGGGVQAWAREALVVLLLTVEAVVPCGTERKVCGHAGVPCKPTLDQPAGRAGGDLLESRAQRDGI